MRTRLAVTIALACFIAITLFLSAREARVPDSANTYSHGEMTCLQGIKGPGLRFRLTQKRCDGRVSYPYLEIDIRKLPIVARKGITICGDNWAFKCRRDESRFPDNESCEPSQGGKIVFDHFEETVGKEISKTDGSYDLRFRTGRETGHFKVDCEPPCG